MNLKENFKDRPTYAANMKWSLVPGAWRLYSFFAHSLIPFLNRNILRLLLKVGEIDFDNLLGAKPFKFGFPVLPNSSLLIIIDVSNRS